MSRDTVPPAPSSETTLPVTALPETVLPLQPSLSILVLDSDPAIRKLLRRLLERCGYFVHELADATELLPELRLRKVDLLIADFGQSRQQEVETIAQLARAHPNLKIIQLASQPLESAAPATLLVLPKPFHSDALLEGVQQAFRSGEADRLPSSSDPQKIGFGQAAP